MKTSKGGVGHKPGSVEGHHSSRRHVTIALKRPTQGQRGPRLCPSIWSCSRRGLPCRRMLPPTRCALTAPFHPYRHQQELALWLIRRRSALCCTFRRLTPPRRYLAPCPVEPGLSSPVNLDGYRRDDLANSAFMVSLKIISEAHSPCFVASDFK